MSVCPAPSSDAGLVRGLTGDVDCHVHVLAHDGYGALFGHALVGSPLFTAVLTIWVALLGYRLLMARSGVSLREAPMLALKLGLVLAFATSWATYQTVVFDLAFRGPEEVAGRLRGVLLAPHSLYGRDALDGLQLTFDHLQAAATAMAGKAGTDAKLTQGGPALGAWALWVSAGVLMLSALGALLVSKVALGLLLALGPAFIAALLFEPTRGLAVGWARAVFGFAFAPLATTVFLTFLFALLEPSLRALEADQAAGEFQMQPVMTLALLVTIFSGAFLVALKLGAQLAATVTLPSPVVAAAVGLASRAAAAAPVPAARAAAPARDRAEGLAQAIASQQAMRARSAAASGDRRLVTVGSATTIAAGVGSVVRGAPAYRRLGEASGSHRFQRRSR